MLRQTKKLRDHMIRWDVQLPGENWREFGLIKFVMVKNTDFKITACIWILIVAHTRSISLGRLSNFLCLHFLSSKMMLIIFPIFRVLWKLNNMIYCYFVWKYLYSAYVLDRVLCLSQIMSSFNLDTPYEVLRIVPGTNLMHT